jgi:hypothetical protein
MYDLEVRSHVSVLRPSRALTEDEVPLPDSLTDPEFTARLVETGGYDASVDDVKITVRRSA